MAPRTKIYVGKLPSCTSEELSQLFEKYGKVKICDIMNGYAFVHMENSEEAEAAIKYLDTFHFKGSVLSVQQSRSEDKIPPKTKIYVGKLPSHCTRDEIRGLFEKFGTVVECDIMADYAFVHMSSPKVAEAAVAALNKCSFKGSLLNVQHSKSKPRFNNGTYGRSGTNFGLGSGQRIGGFMRQGRGESMRYKRPYPFDPYEVPSRFMRPRRSDFCSGEFWKDGFDQRYEPQPEPLFYRREELASPALFPMVTIPSFKTRLDRDVNSDVGDSRPLSYSSYNDRYGIEELSTRYGYFGSNVTKSLPNDNFMRRPSPPHRIQNVLMRRSNYNGF